MVQTSAQFQTLSIKLPDILSLQVTQEQFELLAVANRDL